MFFSSNRDVNLHWIVGGAKMDKQQELIYTLRQIAIVADRLADKLERYFQITA